MNRSVDSSQRSAGSSPMGDRPTHPSHIEHEGRAGYNERLRRHEETAREEALPLMRGYESPSTYGNMPYPIPTSPDVAPGDEGAVWRGRDERHDFWGYDRRPNEHPGLWERVKGVFHGRGPKNYVRSDERIHEEVCERLTDHAYIDASDIEVIVRDGEVTLTGTVDARMVKRAAEEVAEQARGVRDVHNHLRVRRAAPSPSTGH